MAKSRFRPQKQFLDPVAWRYLLGDPQKPFCGIYLYDQIENTLQTSYQKYPPNIGTIPFRLLEHNASPARHKNIAEMLPVDVDLVYSVNMETGKASLYFENMNRPLTQRRVVFSIIQVFSSGYIRAFSVPLQALMLGWGDVTEGHQGYCHSLVLPEKEWFYIGITSRNWRVRMEEHLQEIYSGSNKAFHAAVRPYINGESRAVIHSELVVLNHSFAGIMDWEEEQVDKHFALGNSLNMIPGGFKGIKFLHEHRITKIPVAALEDRERAVSDYVRRAATGRTGVPNPALSQLWSNEEFYLKVLAGREDTLTPGQVRAIRSLAEGGQSPRTICDIVAARNVNQVKRVIAGKTYSRISQQ